MYDHIRGEVVEKQPARVVLRAGGVGYELKVPTGTSAAVQVGETVLLHTILHVVDGSPSLLGFKGRGERDLSRRLLSVSGVGPAMSLAILSTLSPREVSTAVLGGEPALFTRVKGIGPKTAERLCLELRDHVAKLDVETALPVREVIPQGSQDAIAALVTLGYSEKEARTKVLEAARRGPEASTEQLVKAVLRG